MAVHRAIPFNGISALNFDVIGNATKPTTITKNTIWINSSIPIHHWSIDGKEPTHLRSTNKNLAVYPYSNTTKTTNGITYTDNKDGTITASGTASSTAYFRVLYTERIMHLPAGTYTLSGCPSGGGSSTYNIHMTYSYDNFATSSSKSDTGSGATITFTKNVALRINIVIYSGVTVSKLIFKPQLEKASSATSFIKGDATGQVWIQSLNSGGTVSLNALKNGNEMDMQLYMTNMWESNKWVRKVANLIKPDGSTTLINTSDPDVISGSTSGTVYAGSGYNGAGTTIYSGEIDVTDYSSVYVYGSVNGYKNNIGNGGCVVKIGIQGATSGSKSTTVYGGEKVYGGIDNTWDLTGVTGKVKVYCYFTCYSGAGQDSYSTGGLSWTFR